MIRRIDAQARTCCKSKAGDGTQFFDMADKYHLVIFGSTATAQLLALHLAQTHDVKVLVVTDPDRTHFLPTFPQLSAGFCTSPAFFKRVNQSLATGLHLLAPLKNDRLFSKEIVSAFASQKQHLPLLEFAEGAAIHAQIVCERRVHRETNTEQLVFPGTICFNQKEVCQDLTAQNEEQKHYDILRRDSLVTSHFTKDGRFSGRSSEGAKKADRVLLLDQDLILEELNSAPKDLPIIPHNQQIMRFHDAKAGTLAAQQDVSNGLWQFQGSESDVLFSAAGEIDQLATHLFQHHGELINRRVRQIDHMRKLSTQDGYPVFDALGGRKALCFLGAQQYEMAPCTCAG